MPRALITGVAGQDGHYLAKLLVGYGYDVCGLVRPGSFDAATGDLTEVTVMEGDVADSNEIARIIDDVEPDEIYNLAGVSSVPRSHEEPEMTLRVNGLGPLYIFDSVRRAEAAGRSIKVFQASSAEMFGTPREVPQSETTPFMPLNPYAIGKVFAHQMAHQYRKLHGLFIACGICFNHESPRRHPDFVTRKVSQGVAQVKLGITDRFVLADLDSRRDWGFAGDYVDAMWKMLRQREPTDYVIATGKSHTVAELVGTAFSCVGIDDWRRHVVVQPGHENGPRTNDRVGDPSRAHRELGWHPRVSFEKLVAMMVRHDLELLGGSLSS